MKRALSLLACFTAAACSVGSPRRPGVLAIAAPYEIDTLDPHVWNYLGNFALASHFYESLVTTDAEMRIRPCLARSWENPDPYTWTFHLRPGVVFHSGKAFGAPDVVYTIRRLLTQTGLEMTGWVLYVRDVSEADERTVVIRTRRPMAVLLNQLRFVAIVPEGASAPSLAERPDGTGPYELVEWRKGVSIRLSRNERYWGPPPSMGAVTLLLGRSSEQAARDLASGRCQLAQCDSKRLAAELAPSKRFEVLRQTSIRVEFLGFDVRREASPYVSLRPNPFRNRLVRRAVHLALDRDRMAEGLTTDALPASQFVPPFVFGFNPTIPLPVPALDEARALLRRAGVAGGFRATLHARSPFRESASLVKDQLRRIGIEVDVQFLSQVDFQDLVRRREASLFLIRFGCVSGDASDVLDNAIHSRDLSGQMGISNYGGYSNPELDGMIERSGEIDDPAARRKALEGIMARITEELPWLPLSISQDVYAVDRSLAWKPRHDSFILAAEVGRR